MLPPTPAWRFAALMKLPVLPHLLLHLYCGYVILVFPVCSST
jgi:hypothetical protein